MITVGSDIEFFTEDVITGTVSSAIGKIGGSKQRPLVCNYGNLQEDNILAEIGIDPVNIEDETSQLSIAAAANVFNFNLYNVVGQLKTKLFESGLAVTDIASSVVDINVIERGGRKAKQFSCEPDYNAYTRKKNPRINPEIAGNLRTAGGHLHMSWDMDQYNIHPLDFVKSCDVHLGLISVIEDRDCRRRTLYGKAGDFRPKKYPDGSVGVEYRTLSNYWALSSDLKYRIFKRLVKAFTEAPHLNSYISEIGGEDELQRIINTSDIDAAYSLVESLELV